MIFTKILKYERVLTCIIYLVKAHKVFISYILIISLSLNLSSKNKY